MLMHSLPCVLCITEGLRVQCCTCVTTIVKESKVQYSNFRDRAEVDCFTIGLWY